MDGLDLEWRVATKGRLGDLADCHRVAITGSIRSATNRHKAQVRRQARSAGLGAKVPNAFRGVVRAKSGADITRRGIDADPSGATFSKAIIKRPGASPVDLFDVWETGATIKAKGGEFLEIKTPHADRRAKSSRDYPDGTFRYIPMRRRRGRRRANSVAWVLVHRATNEVWFVWLPTVKIRRRLRAGAAYVRIARGVVADFERRYARAVVAKGLYP